MRILQLSEAFGGGVFTSLTRLASGLAARGHDVHLAFARRGETPADVAAHVHPAVTLHELPLTRSIDPWADLLGFLAIRRLLRDLAPDIVHLHSSKAGVIGRAAAFLTGDAGRVFYSPRGLAFLQEDYSPRPRRVALVENAVDVESVVPRVPRGDGLVRVGIVGRVTYARNSALFADLARRHASGNTHFVWVGGGEADDARLLQEAGVAVTGWKSRPEALAEMSRLDIYLHPSRWEGMPIALIEAQIAGLPAVATDVVGNRDVIREGETGFVRADPGGLSDALARLIADPALRASMGSRARTLAVPRFNLERMVDDYERLYATAPPRRTARTPAR